MKKQFVLTLLLTLLCATGMAQKPVTAFEQKQMLAKIEASAKSIQSLQCDFTQEKRLSLLNDKMVSKGVMRFKRPDRLYWHYSSPYTYTFVINGTQVAITSHEKKQVIDVKQNALFQEIVKMMMNSVTGKCLTDKTSFSVKMYRDGANRRAELTPVKKQMKKLFSTITLLIDPAKGMVHTVVMKERSGDTTTIRLNNIRKNVTVDEKVFRIR